MTVSAEETAVIEGRAPKRQPMKSKHKLLLIVFSLLAMGVLRTGFLFFLVAMLPSVVAYLMDGEPGRYSFRAVFYANLAGVLPFLEPMLRHGPSSAALQSVMGSGFTWVAIMGASLVGYLLVRVCPIVTQVVISGVIQTQISHIEHQQRKLEKEWGQEVTQFSTDAPVED